MQRERMIVSTLVAPLAIWFLFPGASAQTVPTTEFRHQQGEPAAFISSSCRPGVPQPNARGVPAALQCEARLVNGSEPLKAIAVQWVAYNASGTEILHSTELQDYAFPLPGSRGATKPGETLVSQGHAPPFASKVVCWIVFAEYANGKIWGDQHSSALLQLRASRKGAEQIISFLKQAKQSLGPKGL